MSNPTHSFAQAPHCAHQRTGNKHSTGTHLWNDPVLPLTSSSGTNMNCPENRRRLPLRDVLRQSSLVFCCKSPLLDWKWQLFDRIVHPCIQFSQVMHKSIIRTTNQAAAFRIAFCDVGRAANLHQFHLCEPVESCTIPINMSISSEAAVLVEHCNFM